MAVERQQVEESTGEHIARTSTILRSRVGSTVHGTGTGTDDIDEMGVCIEPYETVLGLRHFEQHTYRTQPDGVRSGPGDTDVVVYSLRKYCSLALKGNPSVLVLLMVPDSDLTVCHSSLGYTLRENAHLFASQKAGNAYLGYMQRQRERLAGNLGQKKVKRPELEEAFGYDTKYAGHMIRLAFQGVEYMETGRFSIPMPVAQRDVVLAVRRGERTREQALRTAGELEVLLKNAMDHTELPPLPDFGRVNDMLVEMHLEWWGL